MKKILATLPVFALLAACGGGGAGPQTVSGTGTTGVGQTGSTSNQMPEVLKVSGPTTYKSIGGTQQMVETYVTNTNTGATSRNDLYTAEQSTTNSGKVTVTYDPRAAIFSVKLDHEDIGIDSRFQDPAHRTAFGGASQPQTGVPNLSAFNYLQSGAVTPEGGESQTFFYQTPGSNTRYVSLAGFVRNKTVITSNGREDTRTRGTSVFGLQTPSGELPKTGTASYSGNMLATMVSNTELDTDAGMRTRFEWIHGTGSVNVDFGSGSVTTSLTGTVLGTADAFDGPPLDAMNAPHTGQAFSASGTASFDRTGQAYAGTIGSASLGGQSIMIGGSSVDGTFYGPGAAETGLSFRVVGGIPDQRVDITGSFTGAKQ